MDMKKNLTAMLKVLTCLVGLSVLTGCATVQYAALEKVGVHKRDILVDRVEDARDAQENASEQFVSAYERFASLVGVEGGDLERNYKKLKGELDRAEGSAADIDARLRAVDDVANDLFSEWQGELTQYTNPKYRASSERRLGLTKNRYRKRKRSMDTARATVDPVLRVLQDHTLFLKHNLNARALSSLKNEVVAIEGQVGELVKQMQVAIAEANSFIKDVKAN